MAKTTQICIFASQMSLRNLMENSSAMAFLNLARPTVAIAFGAFILCAETRLHFESITRPESLLDLPWHDWAAGLFLLHAGVVRRGKSARSHVYLAAAWGFMTSLLGAAVLAHVEELAAPPSPDEWISARIFFGILLGLLLVSVSALVSTIRQRSLPT